jgi:hypothetical protein
MEAADNERALGVQSYQELDDYLIFQRNRLLFISLKTKTNNNE